MRSTFLGVFGRSAPTLSPPGGSGQGRIRAHRTARPRRLQTALRRPPAPRPHRLPAGTRPSLCAMSSGRAVQVGRTSRRTWPPVVAMT